MIKRKCIDVDINVEREVRTPLGGWRFTIERWGTNRVKAKVAQLDNKRKTTCWKICMFNARPAVDDRGVVRLYTKSGDFSERLAGDMSVGEFTRYLVVAYDYITLDDGV